MHVVQEEGRNPRDKHGASLDRIHATPFIAIEAGTTLRDVAAAASEASTTESTRSFSPMRVRFLTPSSQSFGSLCCTSEAEGAE